MIYLLDTNILIVLIKNRPPQVTERIDQLADADSLAMSFITWAELLRGAAGSQRREATLQQLDALALGATLVSHNVREFARVEGLALVDWASPA